MSTTRSAYWDNIKGFLIALVVLGHYLWDLQTNPLINAVVDAIYMFHMPAFVFVSGYFSKSEHSRGAEALLKLGIAYFLLDGYSILTELFVNHRQPSLIAPYYSAWYLLALIGWRLITPVLVQCRGVLLLSIVVAIFVGFYPEINAEYAAVKMIVFAPFFLAGYFMPRSTVETIKQKSRRLGLIPAALALSIGIFAHEQFHIDDQELLSGSYLGADGLSSMLGRIGFMITASLSIGALLFGALDRRIPLLTTIGKNSLAIYILHRPITLEFAPIMSGRSEVELLSAAILCTLPTVLVLGSNVVADGLRTVLNTCAEAFTLERRTLKHSLCWIALMVSAILILLLPISGRFLPTTTPTPPRVMSVEAKTKIDRSFKIIFAGDLILLEDQVKRAFDGQAYDFAPLFEHTRRYIQAADFSIGVFEGPMGGTARPYSQSNFDDGKFLYLNFPDEFADAVKGAGFDLVTTANNHLLDMDLDGAARTIAILDQKNLPHIGSYVSAEDKAAHRVKVIERGGLKMALLAYTYGVNYHDTDAMINGDSAFVSSFLVDEGDPNYERVLKEVRADFEEAKSYEPDLIVVMPHWGTQFDPKPDRFQRAWQKNFLELGADLILGDHAHCVQPIEMKEVDGRMTCTVFCPGNYANIYREHDGDAGALVEIYVDREDKKIWGGAIIPTWTESPIAGNYRALPINEIINDRALGREISTRDLERVDEVYKHVTKIMLGTEMNLTMAREKIYFDADGVLRSTTPTLELTDGMRRGEFYSAIASGGDGSRKGRVTAACRGTSRLRR